MYNCKQSTLFDVHNVLNMHTGKCYFYYIHDYIYKKCFEFFSAPSRRDIAVQLAENSRIVFSQLDQLKIIQLNDYFFNEIRRFTKKINNNQPIRQFSEEFLKIHGCQHYQSIIEPDRALLNANQENYKCKKMKGKNDKASAITARNNITNETGNFMEFGPQMLTDEVKVNLISI